MKSEQNVALLVSLSTNEKGERQIRKITLPSEPRKTQEPQELKAAVATSTPPYMSWLRYLFEKVRNTT